MCHCRKGKCKCYTKKYVVNIKEEVHPHYHHSHNSHHSHHSHHPHNPFYHQRYGYNNFNHYDGILYNNLYYNNLCYNTNFLRRGYNCNNMVGCNFW